MRRMNQRSGRVLVAPRLLSSLLPLSAADNPPVSAQPASEIEQRSKCWQISSGRSMNSVKLWRSRRSRRTGMFPPQSPPQQFRRSILPPSAPSGTSAR